MTFTYAGEYASDVLYRTQGAAGGVSVAVTTSGNSPATLYTDATKDTPLAGNVVTTDQYGNLTFFADPGTYTCTVGSATFTAVVAVNPLESGGGGSGSVTSVAVESANGLAGTVADPTSTPQITLSTTATGVLKGASGVIGAATAGTDYLAPSGSGAALTGITAAQVGADASGAAATAQGNAESFATSAVATETSRAEAAEALLAPLASPVLTGSPTAPTKTALTNSADIATTAYTDAAVAAETSRAEGAEAANASAVSAETSRAETAESAKLAKAGGTLTGGLELAAGTSSLVPVTFQSGTNLTAAAAGDAEFDGTAFYLTAAAGSRQVVDTEQVCCLAGTYTLAANTNAQPLLNATANGALTVQGATTYLFEVLVYGTGFTTSSHSFQFGFGGTATLTAANWIGFGGAASTGTAAISFSASPSATTFYGATTATTVASILRGTMRVNAGGTVIPQITQLLAGSAGILQPGTQFRCWPIGSGTVAAVGDWS